MNRFTASHATNGFYVNFYYLCKGKPCISPVCKQKIKAYVHRKRFCVVLDIAKAQYLNEPLCAQAAICAKKNAAREKYKPYVDLAPS